MHLRNVFFVSLSIFYSLSASATNIFACNAFKNVSVVGILKGTENLGDQKSQLAFIPSQSALMRLITTETTANLTATTRSVSMGRINTTTSILNPLIFYKTAAPVTLKSFDANFIAELAAQIDPIDNRNGDLTNIVAIVAENYAVLLPETGDAVSVCMNDSNTFNERGAQAGLERLQAAMLSSGMLMSLIPQQFGVQSGSQEIEDLPPSMFGLPEISFDSMADVLSDRNLRMHVVKFTAAAAAATLIIQGYRFLGIGGRQRALAAVIPPGVLENALGRSGYRVPKHEKFSLDDVRTLATQIKNLNSEAQVESLLQQQDPELLAYFKIVCDYVRVAEAMALAPICSNGRCA